MLCSRKFRVSKNVKDKREGDHVFLSKIFCLTVPKLFVGGPFCAVFQKYSGIAEIYGEEGVGYQDFPPKSFCLTVLKKYIGEAVRVSPFLGIDKFYASEG